MSTKSTASKDGYLNLNFIEDYFYSLPSQGNIYTFVPLKNQNGCCKFLVASLQKKIFCMEYSCPGSYSLIEVPFPSIPNGADIISMNAISLPQTDIFTVGVSFCKKEGVEVTESFLNIYWNLDIHSYKEADTPISCCSINLDYMPYHLLYTYEANDINKSSPIWILCGSDSVVHLYKASKNTQNLYEEVYLENMFPEFKQVHDIIVRLEVSYAHDMKSRVTAMCGDKGNIIIFIVDLADLKMPTIKSKRQFSFDFPSSCSKFFKLYSFAPPMFPFLLDDRNKIERDHCSVYTLIATTLESCFVHRDIELDLSGFQLPQSENYDVVTCCLVCDVDFDGINEIFLGTYGQTVLIYHLNHDEDKLDNPWVLSKTLSFSSPVLSLAYEDFLGDGVKELIVHTMAGVHVYQHDPEEISSLLLERLRSIVSQKQNNSEIDWQKSVFHV